jgi:hypothetical protein
MNSYKQSSVSNGKQSSSGTGQNAGKQAGKPFCKVCYDAGKTEREYTSHFVKSKPGNDGKVVCPYLLSLKCTYCKKNEGHTASHCPMLAAKKTQEKKPVVDQDGWEVKKGGKVQAQAQVQQAQQASAHHPQKTGARACEAAHRPQKTGVRACEAAHRPQTTFSVLAEMMVKEEKKELEVEVKRVEYETHFPVGGLKPVAQKLSWGSGKPNWSVIAKQAPAPQPKLVQQQQVLQQVQQKKEEEDDGISDISDDEEERNSDRAWGWSGDWNDCPN